MLRLFLSVDMVGSTQFKAKFSGRASDGWLDTFHTFFTHFPLMLAGQLGFEFLDKEETPAVDVWKMMGDEVIFMAQPSSAEELASILRALLPSFRIATRLLTLILSAPISISASGFPNLRGLPVWFFLSILWNCCLVLTICHRSRSIWSEARS